MAEVIAPPTSLAASENAPPVWLVHAACVGTQIMFGGGAIVGKLGVANFNPILFAMIRECVAGPLLLMIAFYREGFRPIARKDVGWFILSGKRKARCTTLPAFE